MDLDRAEVHYHNRLITTCFGEWLRQHDILHQMDVRDDLLAVDFHHFHQMLEAVRRWRQWMRRQRLSHPVHHLAVIFHNLALGRRLLRRFHSFQCVPPSSSMKTTQTQSTTRESRCQQRFFCRLTDRLQGKKERNTILLTYRRESALGCLHRLSQKVLEAHRERRSHKSNTEHHQKYQMRRFLRRLYNIVRERKNRKREKLLEGFRRWLSFHQSFQKLHHPSHRDGDSSQYDKYRGCFYRYALRRGWYGLLGNIAERDFHCQQLKRCDQIRNQWMVCHYFLRWLRRLKRRALIRRQKLRLLSYEQNLWRLFRRRDIFRLWRFSHRISHEQRKRVSEARQFHHGKSASHCLSRWIEWKKRQIGLHRRVLHGHCQYLLGSLADALARWRSYSLVSISHQRKRMILAVHFFKIFRILLAWKKWRVWQERQSEKRKVLREAQLSYQQHLQRSVCREVITYVVHHPSLFPLYRLRTRIRRYVDIWKRKAPLSDRPPSTKSRRITDRVGKTHGKCQPVNADFSGDVRKRSFPSPRVGALREILGQNPSNIDISTFLSQPPPLNQLHLARKPPKTLSDLSYLDSISTPALLDHTQEPQHSPPSDVLLLPSTDDLSVDKAKRRKEKVFLAMEILNFVQQCQNMLNDV